MLYIDHNLRNKYNEGFREESIREKKDGRKYSRQKGYHYLLELQFVVNMSNIENIKAGIILLEH